MNRITYFLLVFFSCLSFTSLYSQSIEGKKFNTSLEYSYNIKAPSKIIYKDNFDPAPQGAIPGMSSFFDYQTNGNNLRNIVVSGNNIFVSWNHSDSTDPSGLITRKSYYTYSSDGGNNWFTPVSFTFGGTRSAYTSLVIVNGTTGVVPFASGRIYNPGTVGAAWLDAFAGLGSFAQSIPSSGHDLISAPKSGDTILCSQFQGDTLMLRSYKSSSTNFFSSKVIATSPSVIFSNARQYLAVDHSGQRVFSMWYNSNDLRLYYKESTNGGNTFGATEFLHKNGDIINGDTTSPGVSGDIIYKPNSDMKCVAWASLGNGSTYTRKGMKLLYWSPQINGGNPVVIADHNNYDILGDTSNFNKIIGLQVGVSALSHPSLAYSSDGELLYCVYSAVRTDTLDGFNRNEIYISFSTDDGATWFGPYEMTQIIRDGFPEYDELYPTISKTGNSQSDFRVVYQSTKGPGSQSFFDSAPVYRVWQVYEHITYPTGLPGSNNILPEKFLLHQNYPNPFNPETNISFTLPKYTIVTLKVYNVTGELIRTLIDGQMRMSGVHNVLFESKDIPSGIYFYTLSEEGKTQTRKMVLVK